MNLLFILLISVCVTIGILLVFSRELFRVIMGLAVLGTAANLVVFLGGRPGSLVPAVIEAGNSVLPVDAASPLPQALVLTAIVIGFALLCFALVLAAIVADQQGHTDVADYQGSEPPEAARNQSGMPPVIEVD